MKRPPSQLPDVASVTQRLAVLLHAGLSPTSAWQHVARGRAEGGVATAVAVEGSDAGGAPERISRASAGLPALDRQAWNSLAAAWFVAGQVGAPLAAALRTHARALRMLVHIQREVATALAAPVATARMVLALPAVGLIFGALLGFDTLGVLFTTPIGWGCLVVGGGLIVIAVRWNIRLVRSATPTHAAPGLECELMAVAVSGGGSLVQARAVVTQALERFGLPDDGSHLDEVLRLSQEAGVPAAELLRAEADEVRLTADADARAGAAALSVRLMLPLGLCVLPAFMVLGVLPLMVAVISSTVAGF
ncbi:type II secretion system F family protein [Salinibacterium sp. SWN139]|uniref:type II secretion system F family protein n=1 Tax=Salinibacterium sp. SWN139 TaxID=2792055 RepID=UPI0018CE72CF|nr:type II secretion system F family protein [Salinibacterium sp. SWN139]MBH0054891.1 type II secretion system F family protein [Salinibacterium sp. SWN139]